MRKITYYLLNVCTLGFFYLFLKMQAKKIAHQVNTSLTYSQKYHFDIKDFCSDLGDLSNIVKINATLTTLTITVKDINLVNVNLKKKYKIKGFSKNNNTLICIFGDNAKQIALDLNVLMSK